MNRFKPRESLAENFTKQTRLKVSISECIDHTCEQLLGSTDLHGSQDEIIVDDADSEILETLLCGLEAALLHGLKAKLTFSSVLSPITFGISDTSQSFPDFWSLALILSHNEVRASVRRLENVQTDIGRCRAWIRIALNDCLLLSYLSSLTNDISLLYGFYRPCAYLRDRVQIAQLRNALEKLTRIRFELPLDHSSLNVWPVQTLRLIGVCILENDVTHPDEDELQPVMPAMDALRMLDDEEPCTSSMSRRMSQKSIKSVDCSFTPSETKTPGLKKTLSGNSLKEGWSSLPIEEQSPPFARSLPIVDQQNASVSFNQTSILSKKATPKRLQVIDNQSYKSMLNSYSANTAALSSTPDIKEMYFSKKSNTEKKQDLTSDEKNLLAKRGSVYELMSRTNMLEKEKPETQQFLARYTKLQSEKGLDQQSYKCASCGRPIGMIYGKSRVCKYDGFHYCLECHIEEKSIIPSRILNNWDFTKYQVAQENKKRLEATEKDPLIDLKMCNPKLYELIPQMKECLDLRTQLFYLHAYLFTCQENVVNELQQNVWPSEHLFEHIHLYSLADLIQVQNLQLMNNLRKSITSAKRHVISCLLCSQKGFICEICKSSQIIYPFDIESTYRCEQCKAVFHSNCFANRLENQLDTLSICSNEQLNTKEDRPSCPRCVRIRLRKKAYKDGY